MRSTTYSNYVYMYDHFLRKGFGQTKLVNIKYSTILQFYRYLLDQKGIQINTLEIIQTILRPTLQMAVRDDIIRNNPCDGVMAEIKKTSNKKSGIRHALSVEQAESIYALCC